MKSTSRGHAMFAVGRLFRAFAMAGLIIASTMMARAADVSAAMMEAIDSGGAPAERSISIISPGVYKAVVTQRTGGGISQLFDLQNDPQAKQNLAFADRGLLEIGWHGAQYKVAASTQPAYDGCADWPSSGHNDLKATGDLQVIEQSPARIRVRVKSEFVWWSKQVHTDFTVSGIYTFYPAGRIISQVTVQNNGEKPFHWSSEYGPHLMISSAQTANPSGEPMGFGTPAHPEWKGADKAEELTMAYPTSAAVKAGLMITIPAEQQALFTRHMRHGPAGQLGWDRAGYGSNGIVMDKGYQSTWACMIQLGAAGSSLLPEFKAPAVGLGVAADYRKPARITGAEVVTDDPGDFNKDGFNESEGCYVLKGPGPLSFAFAGNEGSAGLAPVFKIKGWTGEAPKVMSVNGKDMLAAAAVVDGSLLIELLGSIGADRVEVKVGK